MTRYKYRLSSYKDLGSDGDRKMFEKWDKIILKTFFVLLLINLSVTTTIDRIKNDNLTETQLAKRIPQTFFWNFK